MVPYAQPPDSFQPSSQCLHVLQLSGSGDSQHTSRAIHVQLQDIAGGVLRVQRTSAYESTLAVACSRHHHRAPCTSSNAAPGEAQFGAMSLARPLRIMYVAGVPLVRGLAHCILRKEAMFVPMCGVCRLEATPNPALCTVDWCAYANAPCDVRMRWDSGYSVRCDVRMRVLLHPPRRMHPPPALPRQAPYNNDVTSKSSQQTADVCQPSRLKPLSCVKCCLALASHRQQ